MKEKTADLWTGSNRALHPVLLRREVKRVIGPNAWGGEMYRVVTFVPS